MDGILAVLGKVGFDWQVALANLVNFLIIFFVLWKFAFKPIGKVIDARNEKIMKGLQDADQYQKLIKEVEVKYAEVLEKARREADGIMAEAKKDGLDQKNKLVQQAKDEVAVMIEAGKKSLEVEKNKMVSDAKKEVVDLIMQSTEKVLMGSADSTLNDRIVKNLQHIK